MRELSEESIRHQAEQLQEYVSRGGAASRWLASKDLSREDEARLLLVYSELDDECA